MEFLSNCFRLQKEINRESLFILLHFDDFLIKNQNHKRRKTILESRESLFVDMSHRIWKASSLFNNILTKFQLLENMCFLELFYYPSTLSFTLSKKKQELYGLLTFSKNNQRYYTIPIIVPPIITLDRCCFTCICYFTCVQDFELSTSIKNPQKI